MAANSALTVYGLFFLFHLLIILGILFFNFVPVKYLWGGQMETKEQLLVFEIISLLIQSLCIFLTLIKSKYINLPKLMSIADIGMWVLFILFLINTVGNMFAKTLFEKLAFTPVTALLSFFSLRLALEKDSKNND